MSFAAAHPFDTVAQTYDASFTDTILGQRLRQAVHERLAAAFPAGASALELGCGTGADAAWLAARGARVTATDASAAMLRTAEGKLARTGLSGQAQVAQLDLERPDAFVPPEPFDGAFSSFGALNCVADRHPLARALARWLRPRGVLVLVVMGPLCAWEIAWHLGQARPRDAFRRLRRGAPAHVGGGSTVGAWYPSPRRLRSELAPWFAHRETLAVGALLPPSYLADVVERRPWLFEWLSEAERRVAGWPGVPWLADHYLSTFERR